MGQPTVNLLFVSKNNPGGFLLFDQQVLIQKVIVPEHREDPQDYMLYTVVLEDADGDGRLSSQDNRSLWISDLYGQGLTRVTAENLSVDGVSFGGDKRKIYIVASLDPNDKTVPKEHWEQTIFVFDVKKKNENYFRLIQPTFKKRVHCSSSKIFSDRAAYFCH